MGLLSVKNEMLQTKTKSLIEKEIEGFDNWEKDILIEYESDVEIFLINFVNNANKSDFLHNLADVLFRCKFNNLHKQIYN